LVLLRVEIARFTQTGLRRKRRCPVWVLLGSG
jgi:hypothetical protein